MAKNKEPETNNSQASKPEANQAAEPKKELPLNGLWGAAGAGYNLAIDAVERADAVAVAVAYTGLTEQQLVFTKLRGKKPVRGVFTFTKDDKGAITYERS